jgi:hypothetical protein
MATSNCPQGGERAVDGDDHVSEASKPAGGEAARLREPVWAPPSAAEWQSYLQECSRRVFGPQEHVGLH